jgi:hypothetical protein
MPPPALAQLPFGATRGDPHPHSRTTLMPGQSRSADPRDLGLTVSPRGRPSPRTSSGHIICVDHHIDDAVRVLKSGSVQPVVHFVELIIEGGHRRRGARSSQKALPIDQLPTRNHHRDLPHVRDVLQRIPVEQHQIRQLGSLDAPDLPLHHQRLCGVDRGRLERSERRQPRLRQQSHLLLHAERGNGT